MTIRSAAKAITTLVLATTVLACVSTGSHGRDSRLEMDLAALAKDVRGTVGIYVEHLATGATAELRADELFPSASMVKVPILLGLFDRIERGELDYTKPLEWEKRRALAGEDVLASFADGEKIALSKVVTLMETFSDNSASLWCQELAGGGESINAWLQANDFEKTRVNSRTPGRRGDWERYGWGQTTPREMARLLVRVLDRAKTSAAGEELYRSLSRSYWTAEALSMIPPWVHCASKQGAVNQSRSEVALVHGPSGAFVFCVITKEQADTSWERSNEGFVLLRRVAAHLWKHFEPDAPWTPAPGAERFH